MAGAENPSEAGRHYEVSEERVEELALKLHADKDPAAPDMAAARRAARRMLQESERRVADPQAGHPAEPGVIHRTSEEAAGAPGPGEDRSG